MWWPEDETKTFKFYYVLFALQCKLDYFYYINKEIENKDINKNY